MVHLCPTCQVQINPNQITLSAILPAQHWHCALDLVAKLWTADIAMDRVTFEAAIRWGNPHLYHHHMMILCKSIHTLHMYTYIYIYIYLYICVYIIHNGIIYIYICIHITIFVYILL